MSSTDRNLELLFTFVKSAKAVTTWSRMNITTEGGMTIPRASVLIALTTRTDPAGMSEIGEHLGMSPRSMTVLIDGLEKEGLVRRVPHQRDRRITCLEITDTGRRFALTELGPSQSAAAALFDDLSTKEQDELLRLLGKVSESLRTRGIDVPRYSGS
ncbi:MarR family winged helix-turn-helix transcriptional regulator [Mycobacterium sp. NPDC050853]|uniref:MarR family winged helix-turn-helix transcriptional regulator n=1 Tax=Mycobacteriaceae TaxID=1762 RepID=UPI0015DE84C1|nr:winged helix-turn-helix transcriptional regulator [Mycobacteroides sp. LB1]